MVARWKLLLFGIPILIAGLVITAPMALRAIGHSHETSMMRRAIPIEGQLEAFRQAHGAYPSSFSEIGIAETESGPFYYRRLSPSEYELSFSISVGESRIFNSATRKWD